MADRTPSHSAAATGSGQKNGFRPVCAQSQRARSTWRAHLHQRAADGNAVQHLAGDGAGGDAHGGFAGGAAAPAAVVADAVFQVVGDVGVAGAVLFGDGAVVAAALVDVLDFQGDGRAGGLAVHDAGEDSDLVGLLPLGGEFRLAGAAAIQPRLDVGFGERDAWRATVDDAADGRAVAFAPGGDAEQVAEAVVAHGGLGTLGSRDIDVRSVGVLHADDMVAAVDMMHLSGDAGR